MYVHAIEMAMPIEVAAAMPPDVASGEVALCASAESSATGVTEVMHAFERNCVPSAAKRSKVEKTSRSSDSGFDDRPRHWTMWPLSVRWQQPRNVAAGVLAEDLDRGRRSADVQRGM